MHFFGEKQPKLTNQSKNTSLDLCYLFLWVECKYFKLTFHGSLNPYLIMNAALIYFHLMFFKSCVFNHDYKAMLLLSEVHNSSQERSAYQHCSRSSMKCHALPLLCRGKTAVTKMTVLAFQASICLQKSNLYYSNSSFCLAQNSTYLRGSSVHVANQPQPSGSDPLQTNCCSKSRINSQIMSPSCIL